MKETIRILHLSDLHFRKEKEDEIREVFLRLGDTVTKIVREGKKPDFIALTGDLVWSGQKADYGFAQAWLNEHLLRPIKGFQKENLLIIPGNHDVDRGKGSLAMCTKRGFENQDEITAILHDKQSRNAILASHKEYINFANRYRPLGQQLKVPWWSRVCERDGISLGFAGLATSLFAFGEDKDVYGNLVLSNYQRDSVFDQLSKTNIKIALIHHPLSYLIEEERRKVQRYLLQNCSLVLRGHLHEQESLLYKTPDDHMVELATGSGYHNRDYNNTFEIIDIDTSEKKVLVHYWIWNEDKWIPDKYAYQATEDHSEFPLRIFSEPEMAKKSYHVTRREIEEKGINKVSYEFVKIPLAQKSAEDLAALLAVIQRNIYKELRKKYANLESRQIRANVFLPDYHGAKRLKKIKLFIPDYFRINMNHRAEWDIKFQPGKGATGVTFVDGKVRYTKRISEGEGEWESKLKMTRKLEKKVHKDLKWIYSVPLIDQFDNNTVLGVMNIDGLDYVVRENDIRAATMKYFVDLFAFMLCLSEESKEEVILLGE